MKRAAIYLRVSTFGQVGRAFSAEGYSIELQRESCQRRARERELEIVAEYVDYGQSARAANRPKFQEMLRRVREHRDLDALIVFNVSRFARNTHDDVVISLELEGLGVEVVSATEHFDGSPFGKLMRRNAAAMAEFYSEDLSQKAKGGLHKKALHGGTPGPCPIGYLNVRKAVEGVNVTIVEPDPDRAPHLAWAFTAYATGGYTLDTLHAALLDRGLVKRQTRKYAATPVSRSHLARILANPYYAGTVRYGGIEYDGKHDPLIDKDTFSRVQMVLKAHGSAGEKDRKHHHYLKGTLVCARCGSRLTFVKARGKMGTIYPYFACISRVARGACDLPYLSAEATEQRLAERYAQIKVQQLATTDPAAWEAHIEDVRAAVDVAIAGMRHTNERTRRQQTARLAAIKTKQTKLLDAYLDETLPRQLVAEKQAALGAEQREAERIMALVDCHAHALESVLHELLDLARNLEASYAAGDHVTRRLINQNVFDQVIVDDDDLDLILDDHFREVTAKDTPRRLRAEARRGVSLDQG